jgi:PhnB protein
MEPTIYLFFKGNCLEAMTHYADTLGGKVEGVMLNRDAPSPADRMPGADDLVMNMMLRLGSTSLMASDNTTDMYETPQGFRVVLEAPSREEFDRIHHALADGARSEEMAPAETFWAERFAMFTDRYGTPWMLSYTGARQMG